MGRYHLEIDIHITLRTIYAKQKVKKQLAYSRSSAKVFASFVIIHVLSPYNIYKL